MTAVQELARHFGTAPACRALGVPRSTLYRFRSRAQRGEVPLGARPRPSRALSDSEQEHVLDTLNSERFVDQAPAEVYATLLDEGVYLCSQRTMYRTLAKHGQVRERRNQVRHPMYKRPELLATRPNEVWSWDITKLLGPVKWTYYYLYVMLDIFSRYVVGWMVAHQELAVLAERLIQETCEKEKILRDQLTIHADRGTSMRSKPVALLLADLGITKSHGRPYVSNDNPFSEAQFRTLKYRPGFPDRFGSIEDARAFCQVFFPWYNTQHRHSGIALMTPNAVHTGRAAELTSARQVVLAAAYRDHPERFVLKQPVPPVVPSAVWINPPSSQEVAH